MKNRTHQISHLAIFTFLLWVSSPVNAEESLEVKIEQMQEQLEALTEVLETEQASSPTSKVHIGGYGELHYNNLNAQDPSRDLNQIDFHRFVLFFGYEFNENMRFVSEFELEHALTKDTADGSGPGEVELEQAYVEFDHTDNSLTQAGVFLIPVGILNETHEPPTFYGVERNSVENIIIPSTFWEAGVQHIRRFGEGWQWNIALHSGLAIPTDSFRIRSGRQKVAEAIANDFAVTTRIKYTGIPGLEVAGTIQYQADPSQASNDGLDDGTLFEGHIAYQGKHFGLRTLYAAWDFNGDAVETAANEADSQDGWYVEPSYKINDKFGVYARISEISAARDQDNFDESEIGFNWWPHPDVVIKFDYRDREHELASATGRDFDGIDLGIGYQF